jgi:predicted protein tyrosine phosphatase
MKTITVMSKRRAVNIKSKMDGPLISIWCSDDEVDIDAGMWTNVFVIAFDDITYPMEGLVLFSETHAKYIREISSRIDKYDAIYIHCQAGISRSVAVAMYIAQKQGREIILKDVDTLEHYNVHVYNTLARQERQEQLNVAFTGL